MKVSKDGVQFFDIDDDEESISAAKAKGYKEYIPMTKNGTDVYNVEFAEDSYQAAVAKGYKDLSRYEFETKKTPREVGAGEALMKGIGNFAGFADEATGLAGAIVNPTDSDKGFMDRYRESRDYARQGDDAALEQQPAAYIGGRIIGGVGAGALIPGAATLGGSVAQGAVTGLGDSKADLTKPSLENFAQAGIDTVAGGAFGAAGYGAGKGLEKTIQAFPKLVDTASVYLKALGRGGNAGAKSASKDAIDFVGVKEATALFGGLKGAIKEIRDVAGDLREWKTVAEQARQIRPLSELSKQQITAIGAGKELAKTSDEEAILLALITDGDNPVKQWFAQKAAMIQPGQVDAEQYGKILAMGAGARNTAREFDPREAAAGIKPVLEDVQGLFKNARDLRYGQLQDQARAAFDPETAAPVFKGLTDAIEDAQTLKSIPGSVRSVLDDVQQMVKFGVGTRQQKLTPGDWRNVGTTEQFNRLQKARELLDAQIRWSNREGLSQAESILRGLRGDIDGVLKLSPEKVEADALFRASKDIEKKFFDVAEFADGIDEQKIARLLGNTDQANRFKASLEDLKRFASNPDLDEAFRSRAADLAGQLEEKMAVMAQKGELGAFRQAQGPTSPAVERLQSISGKQSLVQDAARAPSGFVQTADQFSKFMQKQLGKSIDQLEPEARANAVKFWTWTKRNPDASATEWNATFKKLFPNAENQAAIDQFLKS